MIEFSIQPLTTWLHLHPHWSGVITFLVAFTESLAIIGSVVPGSVTMVAIGILAGAGVIPVWTVFIYAIIGAIAGDGVSFWLGAHFHDELKERWPFKRYPFLLQKGEEFFERHGGKSIVIGRFIGPLRSIIPVVAGMLGMKPLNFVIANIISSVLWSFIHLLPGIIIGAAAADLSPKTATYLTLVILIILSLIWLLTSLFKIITFWLIKFLNSNVNIYWSLMRQHPKLQKLAVFISDPKSPSNYAQLGLTLLFILCSVLFIFLYFAIMHLPFITTMNNSVFHILQSYRSTTLDAIMVTITFAGQFSVLLIVWLVMGAWFLFKRQGWILLHWIVLGLLALICVETLKYSVGYSRPFEIAVLKKYDSFPSAHVAYSVIVLGFLSYLIASKINIGMRRFIYIPSIIMISLIAFSRIFLGAHWLSDVIAACLLSLALLFATIVSYRRKLMPRISLAPLLVIFIATYSICWFTFFKINFYSHLAAYTPKYYETSISYKNWWTNKASFTLPEIRTNRLGENAALLNVQWAATLDDIKHSLEQRGWKQPEDSPMVNLINRITASNTERHMPVLQALYNNHPPVVTLLKDIGKDKPLIMLNLWKSYYRFSDKDIPLWIGSVNYMFIWHPWHIHQNKQISQLPSPLHYFYNDVTNFEVQQRPVKDSLYQKMHANVHYPPVILIISNSPRHPE